MLDFDSDKLECLTDEDIEQIVVNEKFFATEVDEFETEQTRKVPVSAKKNKRAVSPKLETSEEHVIGDQKSKSIIKRNIELAATGDVLTAEERKRINEILGKTNQAIYNRLYE